MPKLVSVWEAYKTDEITFPNSVMILPVPGTTPPISLPVSNFKPTEPELAPLHANDIPKLPLLIMLL